MVTLDFIVNLRISLPPTHTHFLRFLVYIYFTAYQNNVIAFA